MSNEKLDAIDYRILKIIQENGRITNLELSNLIGLSPAPTLERVKKLERSKVIEGYHARINRAKVQLGVSVFINVTLSRQIDNVISRFKERIATVPEIVECYQVTGDSDYLLKVVVKDIAALEKLISEKFSNMDEIGQMRTKLIISDVKKSNLLPLNYER